MQITCTPIEGLNVVATIPFRDQRGTFARYFCINELADLLGNRRIVQINHSYTETVGAVRGLHYQNRPHEEMKFVRCLRGKVWDVAVDLRQGSPTFLQWHAQELTPHNALMFVIPEGCAHGFQVLEEGSEMLYLHTNTYEQGAEGIVRFDDPLIDITWPLPVTDLSNRDLQHPLLQANFQGIQT